MLQSLSLTAQIPPSLIWQKALGGSGFDGAQAIVASPDGGFVVAGYTYSNDGDVTICYFGVTQCVSEKIAARYLKLGATLGGCGGNSAARLGVERVSERPLELSLKAYPNPVQDLVTVEILAPNAGAATFEVLDLTGRVRQTRKQELTEGLNEVEFRLGTLPTGVYLIRSVGVQNRQGVVRVSKE